MKNPSFYPISPANRKSKIGTIASFTSSLDRATVVEQINGWYKYSPFVVLTWQQIYLYWFSEYPILNLETPLDTNPYKPIVTVDGQNAAITPTNAQVESEETVRHCHQ